MKKPIWGENKNQLFADLIPDFTPKVPEFILTPDGLYTWNDFDPYDSTTYPKTECPDMTQFYTDLNGPRGWEGESSTYPGMYYQNLHWKSSTEEELADSINIWTVQKIKRYRQQKMSGFEKPTMVNPEYAIVEAQRQSAFEQYSNLVRSNLIPVGSFQFQGLPLNTSTVEYMWVIDTYPTSTTPNRINPIPTHKLANGPGGTSWKFIPTPLRNPEVITRNTSAGAIIVDLYEEVYRLKLTESTWDLTKDAKMTYLTK